MNSLKMQVTRIFTIILLFTVGWKAKAQEIVELPYTIAVSCKKAVIDKLQRMYVVSKDNSVNVFDENDQLLFRYSNRRIGTITHIDVSNPIKILLYCKDFGRVVVLDNTLSEVQEFMVSDYNFSDVSVVVTTNDNGYWFYDPLRFRLIKINGEGEIIHSSSNLTDYGIFSPKVLNIRESGNRVTLYDEGYGFLIFDNYGQYIKKIPANGIVSFQFDGKNITCFDGKTLYSLDLEFGNKKILYQIKESEKNKVIDVMVSGKGFWEVYEKGLIHIQ